MKHDTMAGNGKGLNPTVLQLSKLQGGVLWLTGLSGSGKSTIAHALVTSLNSLGLSAFALDGDKMRQGLSSDLGFSARDRAENIRRAAEVAKLFAEAGLLCVTAYISPYRADRDIARRICGNRFSEIHIAADLATCEARDPKGLYARARRGEIKDFTGISAPYEAPEVPELRVNTAVMPLPSCIDHILAHVRERYLA